MGILCFVNYFRWNKSRETTDDNKGENPETLGWLCQTGPTHFMYSEEGEAAELGHRSSSFFHCVAVTSWGRACIKPLSAQLGKLLDHGLCSHSFCLPYVLIGWSVFSVFCEKNTQKFCSRSSHLFQCICECFCMLTAVWLEIKISGPTFFSLSTLLISSLH